MPYKRLARFGWTFSMPQILAVLRKMDFFNTHGIYQQPSTRNGLMAAVNIGMPPDHDIRIIEAYRHYTPPVDAPAIIRRLLNTVPEKYLRGLDCVVLTNEVALSRKDRKGKVWSRRRRVDKSYVLARYHHGSRNSLPYIEVRVDKVVDATESWALPIRLIRDIVFGHVVFHELGHHIHSTIRPEHTEKEDVADTWAGKLNANFVRKTYWYGVPVLKIYTFMRRRRWI